MNEQPTNPEVIADSGFILMSQHHAGGSRHVEIECVFKSDPGESVATLELTDRYDELVWSSVASFRTTCRRQYCTASGLHSRLMCALGNGMLFCGTTTFLVPERFRRSSVFAGLRVASSRSGRTPSGLRDRRESRVLRPKSRVGLGKEPTRGDYGFLVTSQEVNQRIELIVDRHRFHNTPSEMDTDALCNLFFGLYAGYDSPLLWK